MTNLTSIRCEANSVGETKDLRAHDALYLNIAEYFRNACSLDGNEKILVTDLPPVYFQHEGTTSSLQFASPVSNVTRTFNDYCRI